MEKDPNEDNNGEGSDDDAKLEQLLRVVDSRTGESQDVRRMLGVKAEDIKESYIRREINNYDIINSKQVGQGAIIETPDMGEYLKGLDTIEFDMGKMSEVRPEGEEEKAKDWDHWWAIKNVNTEKLHMGVINNDLNAIKKYLEDPQLRSTGYQADVNAKLEMNDFKLTPLLLAIQIFSPGSSLDVIQCLLNNYADVNISESRTGFNPLMMACYLVNENDALRIIKLVSEHKYTEDQEHRLININAIDNKFQTVLFHAVFAEKPTVVEYLLMLDDLEKDHHNLEQYLPIDYCKHPGIEKLLSVFQKRTKETQQVKETFGQQLMRFFSIKKKKTNVDLMEFIQKDRQTQMGGRRTVTIEKSADKKINLDYF